MAIHDDSRIHSLLSLPKVEIHLHLEGSVVPADLQQLASRHSRSGSPWPIEEIEEKYRYPNFLGFLQSFKFITEQLREPADYGWIAARLLERLQAMGVLYAEIFFSAGVVLKQKKDLDAIIAAITTASSGVEEKRGLRVNWIFDITRQFGPEMAAEVLDAAIRHRRAGVKNIVALGMGGDENSIPAREFVSIFRRARENGLHVTIHAGEVAGPQSIWEALELLGAERIGHGIAARHDEPLIEHLAAHQIPLECALSSNLCTGAIAKGEEHPFRLFYERGLRVTLNTDDPPLFQTDLLQEYHRAAEQFGFSQKDFVRFNRNALDGIFADSSQKREVERRFAEQLKTLDSAPE